MNRILVVYGTGTGCTAEIAERIGVTLIKRGVKVDVVSAKDAPDPAAYDAVLVGSGIRAGNWHTPVKQWVTKYAPSLQDKRVAMFTACLTLGQDPGKIDEVRAYTDALIAETGITPIDIGLFAGWNEPKKFSFIERSILKMMKAPEGDFRDWAAIESWAGGIANRIGVIAPAPAD
jgi:menaquinone-dependent protoporphyrinogen oxidase